MNVKETGSKITEANIDHSGSEVSVPDETNTSNVGHFNAANKDHTKHLDNETATVDSHTNNEAPDVVESVQDNSLLNGVDTTLNPDKEVGSTERSNPFLAQICDAMEMNGDAVNVRPDDSTRTNTPVTNEVVSDMIENTGKLQAVKTVDNPISTLPETIVSTTSKNNSNQTLNKDQTSKPAEELEDTQSAGNASANTCQPHDFENIPKEPNSNSQSYKDRNLEAQLHNSGGTGTEVADIENDEKETNMTNHDVCSQENRIVELTKENLREHTKRTRKKSQIEGFIGLEHNVSENQHDFINSMDVNTKEEKIHNSSSNETECKTEHDQGKKNLRLDNSIQNKDNVVPEASTEDPQIENFDTDTPTKKKQVFDEDIKAERIDGKPQEEHMEESIEDPGQEQVDTTASDEKRCVNTEGSVLEIVDSKKTDTKKDTNTDCAHEKDGTITPKRKVQLNSPTPSKANQHQNKLVVKKDTTSKVNHKVKAKKKLSVDDVETLVSRDKWSNNQNRNRRTQKIKELESVHQNIDNDNLHDDSGIENDIGDHNGNMENTESKMLKEDRGNSPRMIQRRNKARTNTRLFTKRPVYDAMNTSTKLILLNNSYGKHSRLWKTQKPNPSRSLLIDPKRHLREPTFYLSGDFHSRCSTSESPERYKLPASHFKFDFSDRPDYSKIGDRLYEARLSVNPNRHKACSCHSQPKPKQMNFSPPFYDDSQPTYVFEWERIYAEPPPRTARPSSLSRPSSLGRPPSNLSGKRIVKETVKVPNVKEE